MKFAFIYDERPFQHKKFLTFTVFSDESKSLPFPLNLDFVWRLLISAFMVAILVQGTRLRLRIASYIQSSDTKMNENNVLFCMDQINALFLAISLACCISFNLLSVPAAAISDQLCHLNEISHGLYLSGTIIWRCYIAVFRVLFVKARSWLTEKMGATRLLVLMILSGLALMIGFSIALMMLDPYNYAKRNCFRWSDEAVDIMRSWQVT